MDLSAWLGVTFAGRVVMGKDYCRRVKIQGAFHHLAGMDFGVTDCPGEQRFVCKQLVLVIEIQHDKFFPLKGAHLQPEPVAGGLCGSKRDARFTKVLVKQTQGAFDGAQ